MYLLQKSEFICKPHNPHFHGLTFWLWSNIYGQRSYSQNNFQMSWRACNIRMDCYAIWIKNASEKYQRVVNTMFHDLIWNIMEIYIDAVMVKSKNFRIIW